MSSKNDDDLLMDHNYDGIQEFDNPMPGWWSLIFAMNIVWAAVYFVGINMDFLPEYEDDLRVEMKIQADLEERAKKELPAVTQGMLAGALNAPETVLHGAEVFATNCVACHGKQGQGTIGPNLTDDAWLNGDGKLMGLHEVVSGGTPNGMPAWGSILAQQDVVAVVAFIKTLQGSNPPEAKPPEGRTDG